MKYCIFLIEPSGDEKKIAVLENNEKNQQVVFDDNTVIIQNESQRLVYPFTEKDSKFSFSTALGVITLLPFRGETDEVSSGLKTTHLQLKSSMPGKVLKILCKIGQMVSIGEPLIILEAMKMENEIRSPRAGKIQNIEVEPGQTVESGQVLIKFE